MKIKEMKSCLDCPWFEKVQEIPKVVQRLINKGNWQEAYNLQSSLPIKYVNICHLGGTPSSDGIPEDCPIR
jgi:Zn-finger protein